MLSARLVVVVGDTPRRYNSGVLDHSSSSSSPTNEDQTVHNDNSFSVSIFYLLLFARSYGAMVAMAMGTNKHSKGQADRMIYIQRLRLS